MLITILQFIDGIFTDFIFIPIIFILACRFFPNKFKARGYRYLFRICVILIVLFLIRCFLAEFIFTEVNYHRFTDSGLFPLVKVLFYPNH